MLQRKSHLLLQPTTPTQRRDQYRTKHVSQERTATTNYGMLLSLGSVGMATDEVCWAGGGRSCRRSDLPGQEDKEEGCKEPTMHGLYGEGNHHRSPLTADFLPVNVTVGEERRTTLRFPSEVFHLPSRLLLKITPHSRRVKLIPRTDPRELHLKMTSLQHRQPAVRPTTGW